MTRTRTLLAAWALLLWVLFPPPVLAQAPEVAYVVTTAAGNGTEGFGGDGGPATAAALNRPTAVDVAPDGSLYIADYGNNRIRRVAPDGTIATIAGTGERGYGGDGGPATAAKLAGPYGVRADGAGNVYIADQQNHRVRRVDAAGTITTVAGTGARGYSGDGGQASAAQLSGPNDVLVAPDGSLYVADAGNHRVRRIAPDGRISTVAGNGRVRYNGESGYDGDGGPATAARLNGPSELAMDRSGNLFVGDFNNHAVRRIAPDGTITTVAGTGAAGWNGDGLPAARAQLDEPGGIALLPDGSLVIADGVNNRVRRVGPDGVIRTIAGTGRRGFGGDGGPGAQADFAILDILDADDKGVIYVADHRNSRIRRIAPAAPAARPSAAALRGGERAEVEDLLESMRRGYERITTARVGYTYTRFVAGRPAGMPAGTLEFAAPDRMRLELDVPDYGHVTVVADGSTVTTIDPAEPKPDVRPAIPRWLARMVPGNLEILCLYDWRDQLSTRANMNGSTFRVVAGERWNGRSWTVLEETAGALAVRYWVDPATGLIWRTQQRTAGTEGVTYDGWITSLELGAPIAAGRFSAPAGAGPGRDHE